MKKILLSSLFAISLFGFDIKVHEPYARANPPTVINSASFMVLENISSKDISLLSASSNIAKSVELHTHSLKDGVMTMYQVPKIDILANSKTELKPASFHIMFIDLNKDLKEGDIVNLTLDFLNGEKQELEIPVKSVMQKMKHH